MEKDKSVIKSSFAISFIVLIGKVLGFVKQAVIAWAFGTNATTDIYFAADGYTSMFGQIMGQSVGPTVLTHYVRLGEEGKKRQSKNLINQSFLFFGLVGLCLVVINIILSAGICNIIGIAYSSEQKTELRYFLIALCPVMLFTSLSGVAQGYLDAHKRFIPAKLCSLFFSVSIIIFVVIFRKILGLRSLLYGFLMGYIAHTIYMVALVLPKVGVFFGNPFRDSEFRQMIAKFVPLVVGNSVVDLGHLIDKIVASSLVAGSVSALYYGQVISSDIVNSVIVSSVGTVLLTTLTKKVAGRSCTGEIRVHLQKALCSMTLLSGLLTSLYIVEGSDLIELFFERGSFDSSGTALVSSIASFYAIGFVFMANREVLIKAHYAFQDTITPMINSVIGVVINLCGSIVLSRVMGVSGVAFATSLSMMVVAVLSLFTIKKHLGRFPIDKHGLVDIVKIAIGLGAAIAIGMLLKSIMADWNSIVRMIIVSVVMGIVYLATAVFLREMIITETVIPALKKKK